MRAGFLALPANVQGAFWMGLSAVTSVAMMTTVKLLGPIVPAPMLALIVNIVTLAGLAPAVRDPRRTLATQALPTMILVAASGMAGMVLQFYSYQHMALVEANALTFIRPLFVVILAAVILREAVGLARVAAVLAGFAGVLIMLQPWNQSAGFGLPHVGGVCATLFLAVSIIATKFLTRTETKLGMMVWLAFLSILAALPPSLMMWHWPTGPQAVVLLAFGGLGLVNQMLVIKALSVGDSAALAPIDYTRLVLTGVVGFLLFAEAPKAATIVGAIVIVASTLYITLRDLRAGRAAAAVAAAGQA